ncbi:MAG: OmpA family protein [Planctomycetota bacterium]
MRRIHLLKAVLLPLALGPLFTSCVTESQMRLSVQDRDREIAVLRGEKVELQERIDLLSFEKQDLIARLDSATSRPVTPVNASAPATNSYVTFPELDEAGVTYGSRGDLVVFSMPAEITFASGKATLTSKGQDALKKVAARLKSEFGKDARFYVEGHTDTDPIKKSTFESNRELSVARAMAVLDYLVAGCQVPDERFIVVGHGQYMPVAPGNTSEAKAKNRRVEIVVHKLGT